MDTLVTTQWLAEHLDDPDLVVVDCTVNVGPNFRAASARAEYEAGHIPTAAFVDLTDELRDRESPLELALPSPETFCELMGGLGIGDDSRVVLYDATMSVWAARVWWMLRWVGFDRAALLDGGQVAWELEGRPLSTERPSREPKQLTLALRPELVATRGEVLAAVGDDSIQLLDTLNAEHYRGDWTLYARTGHIPGAVNKSALDLFDDQGRFRPEHELAQLLDGDRDARTITYCGGGVAASGTAFALTRLGFTDVAVYVNSLDEWAADPELPLVNGT